MESKTLIIIGAGAVAAYLLYENSQAVPVPAATAVVPVTPAITPTGTAATASNLAVTPTVQGAPPAPAFYNDVYYKTYQYPALAAQYPELRNPQYQLTDADVTNYFNNYLELQQWWNGEANKQFKTKKAAAQYHWTTFGVPYEYSFIPFTPPKNSNWTPPPVPPKAKSSNSWISTAISVAGAIVIAVAGPNDNGPQLNAGEIELLMTSAAVIKDILPFYLDVDKSLVNSINNKVDSLVSQYA